MEEKDRWSVHLEYLKVSIALATALIAAGAAIYVDASKIPTDESRYYLLVGLGIFFITLICSTYSIASLANLFLHLPRAGIPDPTDPAKLAALQLKRTTLPRHVTGWASASFIFLGLGTAVLAAFFGIRTFAGANAVERATATANVENVRLFDPKKGESAKLKSVEVLTDTYRLTYEVIPGPGTIVVLTDTLGSLKSSTRQ